VILRKAQLLTLGFLILAVPFVLIVQLSSADTPTTTADVPINVKGVTGKLALDSTITVEIDKLSEYLKQPGKEANKFILYLNWRPLKEVTAKAIDSTDTLQFDIMSTDVSKTDASKKEWTALLGKPFAGTLDKNFTHKVTVSIGYEDEKPIPSNVTANLIVIDMTWLWIFLVLFAVALVLFLWLTKVSGIIRDPNTSDQKLPGRQRTYSLGRTQMAFWFFVVIASYIFIWMTTSNRESITDSTLALMGISAVTALGATSVGSSKISTAESKKQNLEIEQDGLSARLKELDAQIATNPVPANLSDLAKEQTEKITRLRQVNRDITNLTVAVAPQKSEGFWNDILSDADGISLHRFQMLIWTIVLGLIFVVSVYDSLAMPQFSATLLALMGISSGSYVGFKFPEK